MYIVCLYYSRRGNMSSQLLACWLAHSWSILLLQLKEEDSSNNFTCPFIMVTFGSIIIISSPSTCLPIRTCNP